MRPPCELVQTEFLPSVRTKLIRLLKENSFSQNQIATKLGITQAAVSKYLTRKTSSGSMHAEVEQLANSLFNMLSIEKASADQVVKAICSTCMTYRIGSHICTKHKERVPELDSVNCQICTELLGGHELSLSQRAKVLSEMQDAMYTIQESSHFHLLVPQVRANLVACDEGAESVLDVAGVPGRITLIDGRARALVGPQFGASRHTASLLLWAKSIWPDVRACLCVSGREEVIQAAKRQKYAIITIKKPTTDSMKIAKGVQSLLIKRKGRMKKPAIQVPGGVGVEPVLYLFGTNVTNLAKSCVAIGEFLSKS